MEKTSSGEALQENYRLGKIGVLTAACVCLMDLSVGSLGLYVSRMALRVDAKCKYIPAHPDFEPPETIQIQRYSSFEKNGIIWFLDAQDAKAPMIADGLTPVRL